MRFKGKILAAVAAATLGLATSASMADSYIGTVTLTYGPYSSGQGGEFTANLSLATTPIQNVYNKGIDPDPTLIPQTPPALIPGTSFQTFCIEGGNHDVTFTPLNWNNPTPYDAYLVQQAGFGEPQTSSDPGGNAGTYLQLQSATAAMYDAFYGGHLAVSDAATSGYRGYDYTDTAGRIVSAGILQDAIWVAQGDWDNVTDGAAQAGIGGNTDAIQQAQDLLNYAPVLWSEGYGKDVYVLNLVSDSHPDDAPDSNGIVNAGGTAAQAQLVEGLQANPNILVPLPPAASVGFAMLAGIGGFGMLRKRLAKRIRIIE